nr:synaptobrevin, longin-like domain protein [Tanacetum cinerariifolium]
TAHSAVPTSLSILKALVDKCKLFPLLGKLSTVSVFLGFGLTFAGTSKYWGVLRILMISLRLIPLVFHIRRFWSTARIETTEKGTKILATVDGILRTVTESSLRRNLKLKDEEGISSFPDAELFENLTLMGYNISPNQKFTFQKGQFSHQWKYLIHTIMQCLSPKSTGFNEFSSNIATALLCLATNRTNFSKMIFDGMVKNVNNKVSKFLMYPRDVNEGKAFPTDSGFGADQDRTNIAKSSTLPHDSAPRVTSPAADEGKRSGDDAQINGRNWDEREAAAERVSDDTKEMATILTFIDAATVLASGVSEVPTSSGSIPTAGPPAAKVPIGSDVVPTAGLSFATATVVTPYTRRKGKETMVDSETPTKKKVQEQIDAQVARELEEQMAREDQRMSKQIARDTKIARIHAEEEQQIMIDGLDRKVSEEVKTPDEVPEEKVKEMMQVVPIEEVEDLNQLWALLKESLNIRPASSDKEMELWVELKILYEPDIEDQL